MVYSSFVWENLNLFLELCFIHVLTSANCELLLLSIPTVIIHACDIMLRFAIFVLDAIVHIWSLVSMSTFIGENFLCSTDHLESQINMQVYI